MPLRSLPVRARLTIWYIIVLGSVLGLFIAGTSFVLYWQLVRQLDHFAVQDIETIEGLLYFTPEGTLSLRDDYHIHPASRLLLERLVEVLSPSGKILYRNQRLGSEPLGGPPFSDEGRDRFSERTFVLRSGARISLVSRYYLLQGKPMVIRLGYSRQTIMAQLREFLLAALTILPLLLATVGVVGYQLAKRTLLPLEQMAVRAEQITAEHLDQRLPVVNASDELGHLARVVNSLLDRLEQSFAQLRRFTGDASHELRTPLAAIRSVGEVGLQRNKTPAEYADTVGSMLEEVGRLTKLIENLLAISRSESGHLSLQICTFSLWDIAREAVGIVEILADERKQTLTVTGDDRLTAKGDRLLVRQALVNVLHNAVKYSPVGGTISVSVAEAVPGRVTVRVQDNGPGIPSEHREKIFDRFYRVDTGRTRDAGGVGLGLSIARLALHSQGGLIFVENSAVGAAFVIEMPAA